MRDRGAIVADAHGIDARQAEPRSGNADISLGREPASGPQHVRQRHQGRIADHHAAFRASA